MELIPIEPLYRVAKVFEHGAEKYKPWSWRLYPASATRVEASILRHMLEHLAGRYTDPESGLPHIDHALAQLMILIQNQEDRSG